MMKQREWGRFLIRLGLIGVMLLCTLYLNSYSFSYELPDRFRKWDATEIPTYWKTDGCFMEFQELWQQAASKWAVVSTTDMGELAGDIGYDNFPTVYCAFEDLAALTLLPKGVEMQTHYLMDEIGQLELAAAHSYWVSGVLVDCDIRLHPLFVGHHNVEEVMLHEFGHCLGISHSNDNNAIMFRFSSGGEAVLHADDLLAACDLYAKCPQWDDELNKLIYPFEWTGDGEFKDKCFYGYVPSGNRWPLESVITEMECAKL